MTGPEAETEITVLVADDNPLVCALLGEWVCAQPGLDLVGTARDADEAIELAHATLPAAAVVDVRMPGGGGPRATRGILSVSPNTRVIAYSVLDASGVVLEMLRAGATSYLVKTTAFDELWDALLRALRGQAVLSPEVTSGVVEELALHLQQESREQEELRELSERIRATVERRRFSQVFQPIADLHTGRAIGIEALTRFPGEPFEPPDRWFSEAARVGLRVDLELAVARAAIARLHELPEHLFMAVNLSPETLPGCSSFVDEDGAERLVVEITEHQAIEDYEALQPHLEALRAGGVRLAVDDAGAGFASLRHTLQLRPDFVKLDMSLTRGIDSDHSRRALAAGLIGFARELGSDIIAEGIETAAELETLRVLGVSVGQGYHIAPPGPLDGYRRQ